MTFSTLLTAGAFGQTPPAAATAAAATAAPAAGGGGDVVRLKNGGVVRGKISELLPGDSVTIVSTAGKPHEFKMSEVSYAGPESGDPTAAPAAPAAAAAKPRSEAKPYVTVNGEEAKLHLESNPAGLTYHREDSSAIAYGHGGVARATGYARLCTSPCQVSLPAGTETLAVSVEGKMPVSAGSVSFPAGESTLVAKYTDNTPIRVGGYVIIAASVIAGSVLMFTANKDGACDQYGYCAKEFDTTQLIVGTSVMIGGGLVGFGLAMVSDSASVERVASAAPPEPRARLGLPSVVTMRTAF